jgi:hypothetical protein
MGELPRPFLSLPTVLLPAGWDVRSAGMALTKGEGDCGTAYVDYGTREPGGATHLKLVENVEDPSSVIPPTGESITLSGEVEAVASVGADGWVTVAWVRGGLGISLASDVVTREELIALATAMVAANP